MSRSKRKRRYFFTEKTSLCSCHFKAVEATQGKHLQWCQLSVSEARAEGKRKGCQMPF